MYVKIKCCWYLAGLVNYLAYCCYLLSWALPLSFSNKIKCRHSSEPEQREAADMLLNFIDMTNETVGDAISDLFQVEVALAAARSGAPAWLQRYADLPCRQLKVTVQVSVLTLI